VGWLTNPAHHGFNPDEPGQKSTRIEICKKKFNPTRTRGEPGWLAGSNPFWQL